MQLMWRRLGERKGRQQTWPAGCQVSYTLQTLLFTGPALKNFTVVLLRSNALQFPEQVLYLYLAMCSISLHARN